MRPRSTWQLRFEYVRDVKEHRGRCAGATVVSTPGEGMANWLERLLATMSRNAQGGAEYFRWPDITVVEPGIRVQI